MGLFLTFSLLLMPYIEFICVPNMLCCFKEPCTQQKINNIFKKSKIYCFSDIIFIFALIIEAFFVYCKVVKEKEYCSFLNR